MASFVHGSLRGGGAGVGVVRSQPLSRRFPYEHLPLSLSPLVTAAEPECFLCVCGCVCLYE